MKTLFTFALVFGLALSAFAQKRTEIKNYFQFKVGEEVHLFGDKVNVRAAPSTKAEVVEQLTANTKLKIAEIYQGDSTKLLTIKGVTASWVKVNFDGAKAKEGFIWSPLIAQYRVRGKYTDFLFGVTKKENDQLYGKLRAVKEGFILDDIEFKTIGDEWHYTYGEIFGNKGLLNVNNIIGANFGMDACGYYSGAQLIVWSEKEEQLSYFGEQSGMADGGILYTDRHYTFPEDKEGRPNKIILKKETGSFDDIGNGKIETLVSIWEWNGARLVKATEW